MIEGGTEDQVKTNWNQFQNMYKRYFMQYVAD